MDHECLIAAYLELSCKLDYTDIRIKSILKVFQEEEHA
jgi:hypothetical protein